MLSIASGVQVAITMTGEIYIVCEQTGRQLRYELKRSGTGLVLFLAGCLGGLNGAAASRILEAGFAIAYSRNDLARMTQAGNADIRPIYAQSAVLTLLACTPTALLLAANRWSHETSLPLILATILLGLLLWAIGLWRMRHPLFQEASRLVRQITNARRQPGRKADAP